MMSFPQTRVTLIRRLASGGSEEDWRQFLSDYRGPVCRFALRWGASCYDDAEDVASQTFEILLERRLLARWASNRSARLRSLLCTVARNILANRHRVEAGRRQLAEDIRQHFEELADEKDRSGDAFYAAWVEDLVQQAVEAAAAEYYRQGKGDYVRVLYGRLCRRLSIAELAEALELKPAAVDNYYRHARQRLAEKLEERLRRQLQRYCPAGELDEELALEWGQLGMYLAEQGGLEEAVRRAYELLDPVQLKEGRQARLAKSVARLTAIRREADDGTSAGGTGQPG
jgi:RNA polymerase sigma factor (sigma-70 family)